MISQIKHPKFLIAFAMFYLAVSLACDPLAYKIIDLKITPIIGASLLFPLLYALIDVIAEIYGQSMARFIMYVHIICDLFFTFVIIAIIHLPSPAWWPYQSMYQQVLDPMGRLSLSGLLGELISYLINIKLIVYWKKIYGGNYYWARSFFSTSISILIYTLITDFVAFIHVQQYSKITLANIITNITFLAFYTLFAVPLVRYLKEVIQEVDPGQTPFNPYKFSDSKKN